MSVNCIQCVGNKRTGSDLLCDFCRAEGSAKRSIQTLSQFDRGVDAMRDALIMLDNGGISLGQHDQTALVQLMLAAWRCPGSVRDAIREVVVGV